MSRRVLLAVLVAFGLVAFPAVAAAVAAAAGPSLSVTMIPGREIDVVGSGFPASVDVLLVITRNGNPDGTQTLRTDTTGGFTTTIDAGPGRGGDYTLIATAGPNKAVTEVVAVETAGGASGGLSGGVRPTPPPTDTDPPAAGAAPTAGIPAILGLTIVGGLLVIGWSLRQARRPGDA